MRLFLLTAALLLLTASTVAQLVSLYTIPEYIIAKPFGGGFGNFPVWILDESLRERSELYLGEHFYVVFDLRGFSGRLRVEIREGDDLIARGIVDGGYVYGYPMLIVEPIYEGRQYVYTVYVWSADTGAFRGRASAGYVEKYCPDAQIVDVSWGEFVYGGSSTVRVAVRNLGERGWAYTVEAWTEGGSTGRASTSLTVPAGGSASASLVLRVTSFKSSTDTLVVRVSCADGRKYVDRRYSISVIPPRPGPFNFTVGVVEARLGEEAAFTINARNLGFDAELVSLSLSEGQYSADLPERVSAGSVVSIPVRFRPERAGEYVVTLRLKYKSPVTGDVYEDSVSMSVRVYARLSVSIRDHVGRPLSIAPNIEGRQTSEVWVLPGRYEVSVPAEVSVSPSEKLVFSTWSTGQRTASITVDVERNVELEAVYNRMYKITLDLTPALPPVEEWAREGDRYFKDVPRYVPAGEGTRWALDALYVDGRPVSSISFTVSGPASVRASWVKEHRVLVDCGGVACLGEGSRLERWVKEGDSFSVEFKPFVDINAQERWRLEGEQRVVLTVERPVVITPRYVKQYLINFGFKIKTATGVKTAVVVLSEWRDVGSSVAVNVNVLKPQESNGVSYRLAGIEVDGEPGASTFTVSRPHDVYVVWDEYFYVDVITSVGSASGAGWYLAGSTAKIEIDRPVHGFLVEDVFKMWVDDMGREYRDDTVLIAVDRPVTIYAVWEKDYTKALALAGGLSATGVVAWKRKEVINTLTRRLNTKSKKIELEPIQEGETKVWAKEETGEKEEDKR